MSLLLCFFIMLFAMSIITPVRFQALADTLSQDFGFSGSSRAKIVGKATTTTISDSGAKSRKISALAGGQPTPGPQGESTTVHAILRSGQTIKVIMFDLEQDTLTPQAIRDLRAVLPVLQGSSQRIMVRGYVVPSEGSGAYQQDTDLAFHRALSVVDYLVTLGLKYEYFDIVVPPATVPDRNLLPAGTDPNLAGASAEIVLLNQTMR